MKTTKTQAVGLFLGLVFALFLVASLLSWSFSEWHILSKIIFWLPTITLGTWTINDYFIHPEK